ncbi:MAG: DUF1178 family protein [Alphaproteobacteria bacterium]|nr:DUF1178 family protein [Alphaproteobacteria bacterium]
MIRFALVCDRGHDFEAWFSSGSAYEKQEAARSISCPACGGTDVRKAPMAPAILRGKSLRGKPKQSERLATQERKKTYAFLKGLRDQLTANADNVGPAFPEEARKMHYGETEARNIYGEASVDEAKALSDEGIPALPLPPLPEDHN